MWWVQSSSVCIYCESGIPSGLGVPAVIIGREGISLTERESADARDDRVRGMRDFIVAIVLKIY